MELEFDSFLNHCASTTYYLSYHHFAMFKLLSSKGRLQETLLLGGFSLLCLSLSLFRVYYSDTRVFLFLNWNLFLAFLPWALTSMAMLFPALQRSRLAVMGLMGSWLLFFPNAPYILTDLFHLRAQTNMPIWFDLVMILSFAWTGLLFGLFSLWDIERILGRSLSRRAIYLISTAMLFLGSFGIYLGRFLRWNSWDIIDEPMRLFYDIGARVMNPLAHPRTWGVTILMGIFLTMVYWSFRMIRERVE